MKRRVSASQGVTEESAVEMGRETSVCNVCKLSWFMASVVELFELAHSLDEEASKKLVTGSCHF